MPRKTRGSEEPRHARWKRLTDEIETAGIEARMTWGVEGPTMSERPVKGAVRHRDFPGWVFELELDADGTVRQLTVTPSTVQQGTDEGAAVYPGTAPAGGVTARMLRRVPLGAISEGLRKDVVGRVAQVKSDRVAQAEWVSDFDENRRPGRRGRSDRFYAELALAYVALLPSAAPVAELAAARHLSTSQMRGLLHEARTRKLLTTPPQGRSGGQLTPKARELLEED